MESIKWVNDANFIYLYGLEKLPQSTILCTNRVPNIEEIYINSLSILILNFPCSVTNTQCKSNVVCFSS